MIEHHFNPIIAVELGIEKAVLLHHLAFQIEKNRANEMHFHEGRFWTYNSLKALNQLFPYIGPKSIHRHLSVLVENGILMKGNFNSVPTDRTVWYAFTDEGWRMFCSISQNCGMHFSELQNAFLKNEKSGETKNPAQNAPQAISQSVEMHFSKQENDIDIDNISSKDINISTTEKEINKEKVRKPKFVADLSFIKNPEHLELFKEWIEYRHQLGCPYKTQKGTEGGYKKLVTLSGGNVSKMREIMDQSISEEWQGLFAIKNQNNGRNNQQSGGAILIPLEEVKGGSSTI